MKHLFSILALAMAIAFPARGATGLSGVVITNLNLKSFKVDLSAVPTNIVKVNLSGPGSPDGPGDIYTFVQQFVATNGTTLWVLTNGVLRNIPAANGYFFATLDGNAPTNVPNLTLFGVNPASGATIDSGSSNIIAGGYFPLFNATWKGVSEATAWGQNVLANSGLTNVADIHAQGNFVFQGLNAASSSNLYGHGHSAGQGATITGSGNLFFDGNESGLGSTFTSDFDISLFNGAMKNASIHDSKNMVAWGVDTFSGLTGAFTNVFGLGPNAGFWLPTGKKNFFAIDPSISTGMGDLSVSNLVVRGTETWTHKLQLLSLGNNVLAAGAFSQWNLVSPTNDPTQVTIALNHGTQTAQKLVIFNYTNGVPANGAFMLTNNTPIPDLGGGLIKLMGGRDWVATNGAWIALEFQSPDWVEMDDRNVFTGAGGADLWTTVVSGGVTNLQPVNLALQPMIQNGLAVGTNTVPFWGALGPTAALVSIRDTSLGDGSAANEIFIQGGTGNFHFSSIDSDIVSSTDGRIQLITQNALTNQAAITLETQDRVPTFTMSVTENGNNITEAFMGPSQPDGSNAPYRFDTHFTHTTGNLAEFANNGTNVLSSSFDGGLFVGRNTAAWYGAPNGATLVHYGDTKKGDPGNSGIQMAETDEDFYSTAVLLPTFDSPSLSITSQSTNSYPNKSVGAFLQVHPYDANFHITDSTNTKPNVVTLDGFGGVSSPSPFFFNYSSSKSSLPNATNSVFQIDYHESPILTVARDSGWTGAGTHFLSDDGTFKAAGGGGDTLWTLSGSTLAATNAAMQIVLSGPNREGSIISDRESDLSGFSASALSVVGLGHLVFDSASIINGANSFAGIGDHAFAGSVLDGGATDSIVAAGNSAMRSAHLVNENDWVAIGASAASGAYAESGAERIAIGTSSFQDSITTNLNGAIGIGFGSFQSATMSQSDNNIGIGRNAFLGVTFLNTFSGGRNIGIGDAVNQGLTAVNLVDTIAIGSSVVVTNSNDCIIGNQNQNYFFPGASWRAFPVVSTESGFSSLATDAAVAISATGITNVLGKNARCLFDGTAMTFIVKDTANSPWYTNSVSVGHAEVTLQNGEAVTISGTGVTGVLKAW